MTDCNGVGSMSGRWVRGDPGPGTDKDPSDMNLARSELRLWQVYDAGGPVLSPKVHYCDGLEVLDWRHGPDLVTALLQAGAQG